MEQIVFNCETVTPMFLAGADVTSAELRLPSIKGAMRFWWRATKGDLSLEKLGEEEGTIFGDTKKKSVFSIRITSGELKKSMAPFPKHLVGATIRGRDLKINILDYLAYGTLKYQRGEGNVFVREYIPASQRFTVFLHISDGKSRDEAIKSFYLLSVFGALGSKARNGFGCFAVSNPDDFKKADLPYPFPDKAFLNTLRINHKPSFSAFSDSMKVFKLKNVYGSWDDCLAEIAVIYKDTRTSLERKHKYEKRQYIGAPLIIGSNQMSLLARHAKPYFMKVIKRNDGCYEGYIVYLSSKYCEGIEQRNIPKDVDRRFEEVCNEFNEYLSKKTEVII